MIDRAGAGVYADLLRYYKVDLVAAVESGSPSPRLLLVLIHGLPDGSWTAALLNNNPELRGWTRETALLADIFDNISVNTVATGMGGGPRKPYMWPGRPGARADDTFVADTRKKGGMRAAFEAALSA